MEEERTMSSRDKILSALRESTKELLLRELQAENDSARDIFAMPDISAFKPTTFENPVDRFIETARTVSGASVVELTDGEGVNDIIRQVYPDAKIVGSHLEQVDATINPDLVEEAKDLMCVDVGVVEGKIGVAENGCIWIPQTMKERAVCFACEYLVILIHKEDIVSNMHEAYAKIERTPEYFNPYRFGTFISGPSKTADIESALVYGAQAARGVTVILI